MDKPTVVELTEANYARLLETRVRVLEEALKKYTYCQHACIDCFCVKEARAALFVPEVKVKTR